MTTGILDPVELQPEECGVATSVEAVSYTHLDVYKRQTGGSAYIAVFAIDAYGDLTPAATSSPIGVAGFSGIAISE